jgi:hypothetical protein
VEAKFLFFAKISVFCKLNLTDFIKFSKRKSAIPAGLYIHVIINQPFNSYFKNSEKKIGPFISATTTEVYLFVQMID